ncbi:b7869682-42c3-4282-bb68-b3cb60aea18f-CDS [Sclerotinia trifoliorum]|uniref:B7869682-42c3-4282-bb68-b3cb60aea18f-CDS n=1 Tax=Sclerotinia trifoliorum TaxID=28548 RepID=A0A8H2VW47_9HELO|nr:b7869682-42c3-4282-bb68-b3cb60aea18f-CDS [Sclerotinia trifoliorum]
MDIEKEKVDVEKMDYHEEHMMNFTKNGLRLHNRGRFILEGLSARKHMTLITVGMKPSSMPNTCKTQESSIRRKRRMGSCTEPSGVFSKISRRMYLAYSTQRVIHHPNRRPVPQKKLSRF